MTYTKKPGVDPAVSNYFAKIGKAKKPGNHRPRIPDAELTLKQKQRRERDLRRKLKSQQESS